jgi:hypothetical protein
MSFERRLNGVIITSELLLHMLREKTHVPEDATVVNLEFIPQNGTIKLIYTSKNAQPLLEGSEVPFNKLRTEFPIG